MKKKIVVRYNGKKSDATLKDLIKKLKSLGCEVRIEDYSYNNAPPNLDEEAFKKLIEEISDWADILLCIITDDIENELYLNWEAVLTSLAGGTVIGVFGPDCDDQQTHVPEGLTSHSDSVISWNIDKIADAVQNNSYYSEKPSGVTRPDHEDTINANC